MNRRADMRRWYLEPRTMTAFLAFISVGNVWAASPDALRALEHTKGVLGVVVPCQDVAIASEIGGILAGVNVRVGDRVRQGQVLFRLNDLDLRQRVEVARAAVRSAKADVARARAAHEVAELAKTRRQRAGDIFSLEDRERANSEEKMAAATLESSIAHVAELSAELARWENDLRRTKVRAPFSGAVAARYLDAGTTVAPTTPIVRIVADNCVLLRFAVPPESLAVFRLGSIAEVVFVHEAKPMRARVRSVAPQVDPAIDLVLIEAELKPPGPGAALPRPGLLCRVTSGR